MMKRKQQCNYDRQNVRTNERRQSSSNRYGDVRCRSTYTRGSNRDRYYQEQYREDAEGDRYYREQKYREDEYGYDTQGTLTGSLLAAMSDIFSLKRKKQKTVRCNNITFDPAVKRGDYTNLKTGEVITFEDS